jgi:amidase
MKSARRTFLQLAASASMLPALSRFAAAQMQTGGIVVEEVTIADLHAAYLSGRTTARAVTQAHLDRIAAYDKRGPLINSLITVNPRALEEADRLDEALRTRGRLVLLSYKFHL